MLPHVRLRTASLIITALGAASALPPSAAAQTGSPLRKGELVRVVIPATDGRREQVVHGRLIRLERDTVTIAAGGGLDVGGAVVPATPMTFSLDGGRQLQRFTQGHRQGGQGALAGAVFGGLMLGAIAGASCENDFVPAGACAAIGAVFGAGGGALVGLAIGSSVETGRWVPVQTSGVRLALGPGMLLLRAEF